MASISWPDWMPAPLQDGFSMQPEDRRIANSTVGTAFFPGFGGDVCVAECTVLLNSLQSQWLERFERDELVHGTRWFQFPLWYAGQVHWEDCRFKTRPKAGSLVGKYTQYQFSLYVRRRSALSDASLASPAAWPSGVPAPQDSSWSFQPEDLRSTTETEVGAVIRPQFDSDILLADCSLVLNRMQSAWFESFEKASVQEGLWFTMPVWYGGQLRDGVCMFKDRPKWTVEALTTTYKFSVLIQKRSLS